MNEPDVIFADEPSGSLDSKNKAELHQLFFDLRDKFGQTFVIVTHDEELALLTDRCIHIIDGQIAEESAPQDNHDNPDKPEKPEMPEMPETPELPQTPECPEIPETQETSSNA